MRSPGGSAAMKTIFRFSTPLVALAVIVAMSATSSPAKGTRGLATITGTVRDNRGLPLGGAVIQLLRDGANQLVKQTYTAANGSFALKIPAGRYSLKAIAQGFSEVVFSSVQVNPSAEIAYRFNLEPASSAKTLVNQRNDKDNVKWTLRSVQSQRSIFQAKEGADATIAAVENSEQAANETAEATEGPRTDDKGRIRTQGVVETYFAGNESAFAPGYEGVNFAVAMPASERIDLIFAGQGGVGEGAPQRFEGTARVRLDDRHSLNLSVAAARLFAVLDGKPRDNLVICQMSERDADEFIDMTSGRGVGLMAMPLSAFSGDPAAAIMNISNQEGSARGLRLVYSRRLNHVWNAAAGYSFGRGQRLSPNGFTNPADLFNNGFFQTAAFQFAGDWSSTGSHVQTVFRFSPQATVFAIDPFAGRLAVYDPSLSVQVSQDLPRFGLPVRAQAIIDARNLLDFQSRINNGERIFEVGPNGRSLRGGILVRF